MTRKNRCLNYANCGKETCHPSGYCDDCRIILEAGYQMILNGPDISRDQRRRKDKGRDYRHREREAA